MIREEMRRRIRKELGVPENLQPLTQAEMRDFHDILRLDDPKIYDCLTEAERLVNIDLDDPSWQSRSIRPIERWHGLIPDELRAIWHSLSHREKMIAFLVAQYNAPLD